MDPVNWLACAIPLRPWGFHADHAGKLSLFVRLPLLFCGSLACFPFMRVPVQCLPVKSLCCFVRVPLMVMVCHLAGCGGWLFLPVFPSCPHCVCQYGMARETNGCPHFIHAPACLEGLLPGGAAMSWPVALLAEFFAVSLSAAIPLR